MANKMSSENFVDSLVDCFVTDTGVASAKGRIHSSGSNQISLKKNSAADKSRIYFPKRARLKMSFPLL